MERSRRIPPNVSPIARSARRPVPTGLFCWMAIIISTTVFGAPPPDTNAQNIFADSTSAQSLSADSTRVSDSTKLPDSAKPSLSATVPDTITDSLKNVIHFDSCNIIGAGIGLSVGSIPLFSLWEKGLPKSLSGFGISDTALRQPTDSSRLAFSVQQNPDIYNMVFPVSVSFDRCFIHSRAGAAVSFSMISKKYASTVTPSADSLRHLDVRQQLSLYTLTLDLIYGRKIPTRFFSVDGVDRTDAIIGISIAPLLSLKKTASIKSRTPDPRFSALADSLGKSASSVSSYGMAFGWRAGIMTLRRLSKQGGLEAGISYFGVWSGRFRASGAPLLERQISSGGADKKEFGALSHRIELSVALVRKAF